jgi:hypothetical protein
MFGIPRQAGKARLPREGMSTTGVEVDVHKIGANIATVRNVVPIKLLCETLANHACRKGVGKHDKIFSDILTLVSLPRIFP